MSTATDDLIRLERNLPDRVELRDVEVNDRLSEETLTFSATIVLDGEEIGEASNRGRGGPNRYHFEAGPVDRRVRRDQLDTVAVEWLRNEHGEEAAEPLDLLVEALLCDHEVRRAAERNGADGYPLTAEVCRGWVSWDDDARPGDLLGGMWEDRAVVGFRPDPTEDVTPEESVRQDLVHEGWEAYRIVRA